MVRVRSHITDEPIKDMRRMEDILLTMRSDGEAYYGCLGKAREFYRSPQE
jgi:hypothetical protein